MQPSITLRHSSWIQNRLSFVKQAMRGTFAGCLLAIVASRSVFALDATMENLSFETADKGTAKFAKIEIVGTNLTQEEVNKLFASATSQQEREALFAKLDAEKVIFQGIVLSQKTSTLTINNAQLATIKAGKIAVAGFEGAEANFTDELGAKGTFKASKLAIDGADISSLFSANAGNFAVKRFAMQDMLLTVPDKDTPPTAVGGNLLTLKLASIAFDAQFEGSIPLKVSGSLKDFALVPPPASQLAQQLSFAGYDKLVLGFDYAASYDPASRALSLEDMTISGIGAGALKLKFRMGGLDKIAFTGTQDEKNAAFLQAALGSVILHYTDQGLINKSLALLAHEQKKKPEELKAEAAASIRQIVPVMLGGAPNALQAAESIVQFINAPSSLGVNVTPKGGAVPVLELIELGEPVAALARIEVDIQSGKEAASLASLPAILPSYTPKASPPQPSQKSASAPSTAAPRATKALTGLEALNKLVGNTVIGNNADGDPLYEYYLSNGSVKQWFDGDVITGKWNLKGKEICFKYPDDEEEACYGLQVTDNTAIFTDENGAKTTYEIMPGNAKKL